ncbi:MAG: hypothetical protein M3378_04160 [Actinomycetota bacterium]|nr:hypothetical protein [Actinomycetota bacterium]MDQ3679733.1 hypothetical protein [Actinomycetota bacterium]
MTASTETRSLSELKEERDHLLRSLEDLDRELAGGDIEGADYEALKDDYTARAAAVLRAIEAAESNRSHTDEGRASPPEGRRPRRGRPAVAVLGLVALAVVAGVLVSRSADERLPGEPATGDIAATGPTGDLARDLARARQLTGEGQTFAAVKMYDDVLARDPRQPEALAYRGWLVRLVGRQAGNQELVDKGLEYLNRAVAADPSYPDAHFFRGLVLFQDKADPASAVPELRAFLDAGPPPEMVAGVEEVLRQAQAAAGAR